MQRIVFIGAIFIASAFAAVQGNCPSYACFKTGDSCAAPCGTCLMDLQTCITANFANATGVCACLTNGIACVSGRADATICQISIKASAMAFPQNCSTLAGANCTACGVIAAYPNPPAISTVTICNPLTDYCNAAKVCATKIAPGGACGGVIADECAVTANTVYTCKAGTCQRASTSYANDLCTVNTDCVGKMNCTAGVCQGFPNGTACTLNSECVPGYYCSAGFCAPYLIAGATCTKGVQEACGLAGTCGNAGTCVLPYTAMSGALCSALSYPPECTFGTYCNPLAGNCTMAPPTPTCYNTTDCAVTGAASVCACVVGRTDGKGVCSSTVTSTANLAGCTAQATTLLTCTTTNMCRNNPYGDSFTCVGTKCKNELAAYNTCVNGPSIYATVCAVPTSAATGATSAGGSGSATKPNSAATMTVGAAVLALSAAML